MMIRLPAKAYVFAAPACVAVVATAFVSVCAAGESARKDSTARCGDEKTQSGYFLSVIREIALNGDLTDRKSLETILETKFDAPQEIADGQGAPHAVYSSTTMFGRPASVVYDQGRAITLTITMPPSWPALPPAMVEGCFADFGGAAQRRRVDGMPGSSWAKSIPRALDGGGKLRVAWSDPANSGRVDAVAIALER